MPTTAPKSASSTSASTVPKATPAAAGSSAATMARPANGTSTQTQQFGAQQALDFWKQLDQAVDQLGSELKGYGEPGVVGRDTILLRSFFDQIVGRTMQIAHAYKIQWTPPQNVARGGR